MPTSEIATVPGVVDVVLVRGARAPAGARPDLLLEVPHGATRTADFRALRRQIRGTLPEGLEDFFHVNTDVGAPEVAERLAARIVAAEPARSVRVLRCRLPRTLVDVNRVIDPKAPATRSSAGGTTPGIVEYVKDPADLRLLLERYATYQGVAARAYAEVCGDGGTAAMVHSYAPREVDVPVDERIVERLRDAYRPERVGTWPLRAEVDLITRTTDGRRVVDEDLVLRVQDAFARAGVACQTDASYALHPGTTGHLFATRYPGLTLCVEMRRDLLAREFTPFQEMEIDPAKADRMAGALDEALRGWWASR